MPANPLQNDPVARDLFDALMERIEPRLCLSRKKETAALLAKMSKDDRRKTLDEFQKAMVTFYEQWPAFVEEAKGQVKKLGRFCRHQEEQKADEGKLEAATDALDSFSDDNS